jgi:outer membrane protein assembly factor BamA
MKWLLPFLVLAAVPGFAQAPAPAQKKAAAPARWPIESLQVEGNHSYTPEQVLAVAALRIGQVAGRPEFEAARDRLLACGAFDTVSYKFVPAEAGQPVAAAHGYVATFTVTEIEQVYPVFFDDLHVSERDLMNALKAKDPLFAQGKLPATQPVFQRYAKWVEEYLTAKGIHEKIVGSVVPDRGDYFISFHPDRPLPAVALVFFKGNVVVTQTVLQNAVMGVALGLPYTEDRFREVLNNSVRPVYEARGHVRVSFPTITTVPNKDVTGLNVTVTVDEGDTYKLGNVAIDGPTPVSADELLKTGDFKTGDLVNFDHVNEGLERMKKTLRHDGYMKAQLTTRRTIDDDKRTVALTLWVDAGPLFTMRKLNIVGLDLDGEAEIERIWTMKPGNPFNPDYPDLFLKRIKEEGVFENLGKTNAEYKINDQDHTADVTLTFSGGAPPPGGRGGRRGGRGY